MRKRRGWVVGAALLSVAVLLALGLPHAHAQAGQRGNDDCVLCHVHHAPIVESGTVEPVPEFAVAARAEEVLDGEERDPALGRHPSRAPPA